MPFIKSGVLSSGRNTHIKPPASQRLAGQPLTDVFTSASIINDFAKAKITAKKGTQLVKTKVFDKVTGEIKDAVFKIKKIGLMEQIFLKVDGKYYGDIELKYITPDLAKKDTVLQMRDYAKDGAVNIKWMESKCPGAGTMLHQAAVLRSQELGYSGRVTLEAKYNSHCFHYKSGFRPVGDDADRQTAKILEAIKESKITGKRADTSHLGMISMALHPVVQ